MTERYMRWQRETRYYEVRTYRDLLGDMVLSKIWGRIGSPLGSSVSQVNVSESEIDVLIQQIDNRRQKRGYELVKTL